MHGLKKLENEMFRRRITLRLTVLTVPSLNNASTCVFGQISQITDQRRLAIDNTGASTTRAPLACPEQERVEGPIRPRTSQLGACSHCVSASPCLRV